MKKAVFNWSGGKDSALALYNVLNNGEYEIVSLLTTVNKENGRSSMHGIPSHLLKKQAKSIGIPIYIIEMLPNGELSSYDDVMNRSVQHFKSLGVEHFIFGDIFLHDVKSYREKKLNPEGITVVEPLWDKTTAEVMSDFLSSGLKTIIVTTTADILDDSYIGKVIDEDFIKNIPVGVDLCGENGEYHTFCYDGPIFREPIDFKLGEPLSKTFPINLDDGSTQDFTYWFANLLDT